MKKTNNIVIPHLKAELNAITTAFNQTSSTKAVLPVGFAICTACAKVTITASTETFTKHLITELSSRGYIINLIPEVSNGFFVIGLDTNMYLDAIKPTVTKITQETLSKFGARLVKQSDNTYAIIAENTNIYSVWEAIRLSGFSVSDVLGNFFTVKVAA